MERERDGRRGRGREKEGEGGKGRKVEDFGTI